MKHAELVEEAEKLGLDPTIWENLELILKIYQRGYGDGGRDVSHQWMNVIDGRNK